MATGPSLTSEDAAHCRGRAPVIAINDAHRIATWADVLYSSDNRWWEFYRGVPEFAGLKFGIQPLKPNADWNVSVLRNTGDIGVERDPSGLRTGRNSGAAAINLARHLGAARVALLGYDLGRTSGKSHFFGEHPQRIRTDSPYASFIAMFQSMVEPLRQLGVEVINCSQSTQLECFQRADLREVLR